MSYVCVAWRSWKIRQNFLKIPNSVWQLWVCNTKIAMRFNFGKNSSTSFRNFEYYNINQNKVVNFLTKISIVNTLTVLNCQQLKFSFLLPNVSQATIYCLWYVNIFNITIKRNTNIIVLPSKTNWTNKYFYLSNIRDPKFELFNHMNIFIHLIERPPNNSSDEIRRNSFCSLWMIRISTYQEKKMISIKLTEKIFSYFWYLFFSLFRW